MYIEYRYARRPSVTLSGTRVGIYDPGNPTRLLGESWVHQANESDDQALIQRPLLPADELLLYHQVWRALLRGSDSYSAPLSSGTRAAPTKRPSLPVELVRLVVRAAELMVPDRNQTQRTRRSVFIGVVTRDEAPIVSRVWFWTKPLDIAQIAAMQLVTLSRDQGWVSPPTETCHSWFEWGVFNAGVPPHDETDIRGGVDGAITGNEAPWKSQRSVQTDRRESVLGEGTWRRTHGNLVACGRYEQYEGPRVGMEDELWEGVKAGAVIAVRACAQQALWENDALYGEILVWKWFEPIVGVA
ncbi:hypothetical protein C8J57DRAFT_1347208 [Mycena rebaudengoi]|nr:hypothetical protein C8J57DRAFT_1347208 [Mycena rebaudengoi]